MDNAHKRVACGITLTLASLILSGCGPTPEQRRASEERRDARGVPVCQEIGSDGNSGAVCTVNLNGVKCAVVVPDDESANSLADKQQLIECPENQKEATNG